HRRTLPQPGLPHRPPCLCLPIPLRGDTADAAELGEGGGYRRPGEEPSRFHVRPRRRHGALYARPGGACPPDRGGLARSRRVERRTAAAKGRLVLVARGLTIVRPFPAIFPAITANF